MPVSATLLDLIEQFADGYLSSADLAERIVKQAEADGITKDEVRELLESALQKRGLSDRQARRVIPEEFKNKKMRRIREKPEKIADIMSANIATEAPKSLPEPPQDYEEITTIEAVPEQRRITMPKRLLVELYRISGRYAKPFSFVLIVENDTVVAVEEQPVFVEATA